MSLYNIFDVAGSGMSAQTTRLNLVASNMANAETVSSSTGETYRARQPVFGTVLQNEMSKQGSPSQGVRVLGVVESQTPLRTEYAPQHPMANADGYIFKPNVNVVEEMANMMSASQSYKNNVEMLNTAKQLLQETLKIGQ
ncbi:MAG: flagellar basal body rod protein FlgC [Cycloclasticus sp.]|jgi:flagellar basal-body rod protein FlgC|nr:flagellar basal body rod protein FlgC [Cycloclasticus sp.]MDF1688171.1 flagellar basal body rod protein FlgC [Cycloclasticus sp.]MEE4291432.1 flagellar basal body rod protein FlgC [Cycloclasticus sp.]